MGGVIGLNLVVGGVIRLNNTLLPGNGRCHRVEPGSGRCRLNNHCLPGNGRCHRVEPGSGRCHPVKQHTTPW